MRGTGRAAFGAAIVGVVLLCTACAGAEPTPTTGSSSAPAPGPSASPSPTTTAPAVPELHPDGTADENLPLFAAVAAEVWAGPDRASGRAYVDALVAAGFPKDAMQVTADLTTIGNPVDSIEFSVLWGEECLVGQAGPEIGEAVAVVLPALADGRCLVGITRPIDW